MFYLVVGVLLLLRGEPLLDWLITASCIDRLAIVRCLSILKSSAKSIHQDSHGRVSSGGSLFCQ